MTTPRAIAHNLLRIGVVAAVTAVVAGGGLVHSQPSGPATLPTVSQVVTVPAHVDSDPPAPAPRGLAVNGQSGARAGLTVVNAVTQPCPGTSKDETRLGLMNHTAMYAHCDYP